VQSGEVASIGTRVDDVYVSIGPQFLKRFSEQFYSSPNKAFEELVSNSWDAGARVVHIGIPNDLADPAAAIWILDDGESMDVNGFRALWTIASSHKRKNVKPGARSPIGKFGIGKLATYVLADELTYLCKAKDGPIRAITMDYRRIEKNPGASEKLTIKEVPLPVREVTLQDAERLLRGIPNGKHILELIRAGVPAPEQAVQWQDEYGGIDVGPPPSQGTWTLAILSSLKGAGEDLQLGWIRRLLRTALPLGASMAVVLNGEPLAPSKIGVEIAEEWVLGENLGITKVTLLTGDVVLVTEKSDPPRVEVEGVPGVITGRVRLYKDKISGGKSDIFETSNGFHVNLLGRVMNLDRRDFGLDNLSHSAWAKFRATVRADGLDPVLGVNREVIRQSDELRVFQGFLMALFNKARTAHDQMAKAAWPDVGDILTEAWSSVPLQPLVRVIIEGLGSATGLPPFADGAKVVDPYATKEEWEGLAQEPGKLIENVAFESLSSEEALVKYDIAGKRVVVNRNHPFVREHAATHEEQLVLRDTALVDLLTQAWMLDIGIADSQLREIEDYRDQSLRLVAQVRRRTGVQIAEMLINATSRSKGLERAVTDALDYLGFVVEPLGQPGEPEGVATAPTTPWEGDVQAAYKFTYDAKSSKSGKVTTGNLNTAGLVRHKEKYEADHILVIAPEYQEGALQKECSKHGVAPMRASDLAALLMLSGSVGPIDLNAFRAVFELHDPEQVHQWVQQLAASMKSRRGLSLRLVLEALQNIGFRGPNSVTTSVIADRIGTSTSSTPTRAEVQNVIRGLSVLVPSLIRITGDDVYLSASPEKLRDAILRQISGVPEEYLFGMDQELATEQMPVREDIDRG